MSYGIAIVRTLTHAWNGSDNIPWPNFPAQEIRIPSCLQQSRRQQTASPEPAVCSDIRYQQRVRARYQNLYSTAEAAVQNTTDGTILGNLNDSKDAIGALIAADDR